MKNIIPCLKVSVRNFLSGGCLVAALALPTLSNAGTLSFSALTSDASSGISPLNVYTHLVDFNGDGASINGVAFFAGAATGANYSLTGAANAFSPNTQNELPSPAGDGINDLTDNFFFGGPVENLSLTGLIPDAFYRASFFVAGWGGAAQLVKADDDNIQRLFDRDGDLDTATSPTTPMLVNFDYTAKSDGSINITFTEGTLGNSFHQFGFANQLISVPEPAGLGLAGLGLAGMLVRRRRA